MEKQFIYSEYFSKKLLEVSGFETPEIRLLLEQGRTPSIDEFVLNVFLEGQRMTTLKRFYFPDDLNVTDCKQIICEEFKVDPKLYSFWDLDMMGNACTQVKQEKKGWGNNRISNGETILLKKIEREVRENFV